MRKLYTLPLSILGILFFISSSSVFGQKNGLPYAYIVAMDDNFDVTLNSSSGLDIRRNDTIKTTLLDNVPLYSITKNPSKGKVLNFNSGTGYFIYECLNNFIGLDTFYYSLCNGSGYCSSAKIIVNVLPNLKPIVGNDIVKVGFSTTTYEDILHNDIDPDGDYIYDYTITFLKKPKYGIFNQTADGFEYTANQDFVGVDTLKYRVCDDVGVCGEGFVFLSLDTRPPVAKDDTITIQYNLQTYIDISENDSTPSINGFRNYINYSTYAILSKKTNNTATINVQKYFNLEETAFIIYTPLNGFVGKDTISYKVCNEDELCDTAKVYITVSPRAILDAKNINITLDNTDLKSVEVDLFDEYISFLRANNGVTINSKILQSPKNGIMPNLNGDKTTYQYELTNLKFVGKDTAKYQICSSEGSCDTSLFIITVNDNNQAPIAVDDYFTSNSTILKVTLYDNDTDLEYRWETIYKLLTQPKLGSAIFDENGYIEYTPTPNTLGVDTMSYQMCDYFGKCDTAKIHITIVPYVAPPAKVFKISYDIIGDKEGLYFSDHYYEDDVVYTYQILKNALHGVGTLSDDHFIYRLSDMNFIGKDTISVLVCTDAQCKDTVYIEVNVYNGNTAPYTSDAEITISGRYDGYLNTEYAFDEEGNIDAFKLLSTPKKGIMTLSDGGDFTYTPNPNTFGNDTILYQVCDVYGLCDTGKIVFIIEKNEAPTAVDDVYDMGGQNYIYGDVSTNDFDVDYNLDNFGYKLIKNAQKGYLEFGADGSFNYSPNATSGIDTIKYSVCDVLGACDTAYLIIKIKTSSNSNNPPSANTDYVAMPQNTSTSINWSANDSDPDNDLDLKSFVIIKQPYAGVATANQNGTCQYTPNIGFTGTDSLTYRVCDLKNNCATATIYVNVDFINHAPIAKDTTFTTNINTPLSNSLKKLVSDVDNNLDTASFAIVLRNTTRGTKVLNQFGSFTYTPNTGFIGSDTCYYSVCDRLGMCDTGMIIIKIVNNNTSLSIINQPLNIEECLGGNATLQIGVAGGTGVVTYNWQQSTDGVNFATIAGATMPSYMPFSTSLGVTFYRCVVKAGTETVTSNSSMVTVKPSIFFTTQPINIKLLYKSGTINADSNAVFKAAVMGGSGMMSYQWQCSSNNSTWSNLTENTTNVGTKTTTLTLVKPKISEVPYFHLVASSTGSGCQAATSATGILTFEVRPTANIAPDAVNDNFTTIQAVAINATVATNDVDAEGALNVNSFKVVKNPKNGSLTLFANGSFTYLPATTFIGTDTASYSVCDMQGLCDTALIFFKVIKGNHLPTIAKDAFATKMNTALKGSVALNDTDFDNNLNKSSYKIITNPKNGNVKMWANGDILYLPKQNFIGKDTFYYQACDSLGLCGIAEAIVTTRGGFITGKIYYDANNNGVFDAGELGMPNELVTFDTDGKTFTNSKGDFQIAADTSKSYVITPTLNNPLWTVNPLSKTVKTSNNFDQLIENQYFTVRPASQVSDLAINVEAGNARPGFSSVTTLTYYNKGTTVLNGKVTLTLDNNVAYESSDVALTQRSGNLLTWSVVNLQPFESRNLMIFTKTSVSAPLNGNVVYAYEGTLTGATDADATNSKGTATIAIRGSYDPNDITVDRREYIRKATDATTPNVPLAYTIRFQNTGNAEAIRVEVLDTIQEKLDLTAFEMIAASHKFEVQIVPDTNKVKRTYTVVKWIFDNINLLDSTSKEACSHGFVKYNIKNISTKTNYIKDSILNKAAIYFDFNAPVLTNTASTKFSTLTVSSLEQYNLEFRAYPNPTNGIVNIELAKEADATIEVFNAIGQAVSRQILRGSNGQIDMSGFQTGFYIVKIKTQKGSGSVKIFKE
jgi:Bacterial Ig domain/Secretion system C-terminal sorting domain